MIQGNVSVYGIEPVKNVRRAVKRSVRSWARRQKTLRFLPDLGWYEAVVERLPDSGTYWCSVEVELGSTRWIGSAAAKDLGGAVQRALESMTMESAYTRRVPSVARQHREELAAS